MKIGDEAFNRLVAEGQKRIDEMRAELPTDGTIPLPFRCYGCDRKRYDYCLLTGDGLPLCQACFDGCVDAACGKGVPK